jgi:[citrate (pro-3S)-lyase] ligase
MYTESNLSLLQLPLSDALSAQKARGFLRQNNLDLSENLDYFCGIFDGDNLLACGGYEKDVIKCVAVSESARDMQLTNTLISHLRSRLNALNVNNIFIYTKITNQKIFENLAFYPVGKSSQTILMESDPRGISKYCKELEQYKEEGVCGAVVLNANPFTKGHRFLVEHALKKCDFLYIFVVEEDKSAVRFEDRYDLVQKGVADLKNVRVIKGGKYIVSNATFPTYFLKEKELIDTNCSQLDADIFGSHIAKALNITKRFVGTEPADIVTADYNVRLREILVKYGIDLIEIERLVLYGEIVSASKVRRLIKANRPEDTKPFVPSSTYEFIMSEKSHYLKLK